MSSENSSADRWIRAAERLARRANFALVLHRAGPALGVLAVVAAGALLVLRRAGGPVSAVALGAVVALAGIAVVTFRRERKAFLATADALVRLDVHHGHDGRLVAAFEGVGPMPVPPGRFRPAVRWRLARAAVPALVAAILVGGALFVPMPRSAEGGGSRREPMAVTRAAEEIRKLREDGVADSAALDDLEARLEELRRIPEESWYDPSTLEAADTLAERVAASAADLSQRLDDASRAADELAESAGGAMSESEASRLAAELRKAGGKLELGTLPANRELVSSLRNLDASKLRTMTPAQAKELSKALSTASASAKSSLGTAKASCPNGTCGQPGCGKCAAGGSGRGAGKGDGPGSGGVGRGPGHAPLPLDNEAPRRDGGMETVASRDLEGAQLGDTIAIEAGRHVPDGTVRPAAGGGSAAPAPDSGEAAWKNGTDPGEEELLRRYFR